MILLHDFSFEPLAKNLVVSIGYFDGIHLGHQFLIQKLLAYQQKHDNYRSLIITFKNHPLSILNPKISPKNLMQNEQKVKALESLSIDYCLNLSFTESLSKIQAFDFLSQIKKMASHQIHLILGEGFSFGHQRSGNAITLPQFAEKLPFFSYEVLPLYSSSNQSPLSSTLIRELISQGEIEKANKSLITPYSISGKIIHGNQIARTLNTKTTNVSIPPDKTLPKEGLYAGHTIYNHKSYLSLIYFEKKDPLTIESWLANFDQEIYGETITILPKRLIRSPIKGISLSQLSKQIEEDKKKLFELVF